MFSILRASEEKNNVPFRCLPNPGTVSKMACLLEPNRSISIDYGGPAQANKRGKSETNSCSHDADRCVNTANNIRNTISF